MVLVRDSQSFAREFGYPSRTATITIKTDSSGIVYDHHIALDHYTGDQDSIMNFQRSIADFVKRTTKENQEDGVVRGVYQALTEAARNSYQHANGSGPKPIDLKMSEYPDGSVVFELDDHGHGFDAKAVIENNGRTREKINGYVINHAYLDSDQKNSLREVIGMSMAGHLSEVAVHTWMENQSNMELFEGHGAGMELFKMIEDDKGVEISYNPNGTKFRVVARANPDYRRKSQQRELNIVA